MSERYIVSGSSVFSPMRKAGAGIDGQTITSTARERALEVVAQSSCRVRIARP